jgi:hypothetical protein
MPESKSGALPLGDTPMLIYDVRDTMSELSYLQILSLATPIGFEPTISCVTGRHVNHYTTGPQGAGYKAHTLILNYESGGR